MWIIGDVHGAFDSYFWTINKMHLPGDKIIDCSLQLGDFGVFNDRDIANLKKRKFFTQADKHKIFRGNHDNPEIFGRIPNNLGDYGYLPDQEMFWVAGGWSIDRESRTEGVDWWRDEEISYDQLSRALQMFVDIKPKIMISHECPTAIKLDALSNGYKLNITSRTEAALEAMFEAHKPDLWVFGHHHKRIERDLWGTHFVGLGEMLYGPLKSCIYEIPGLEW